LSAENVIYVNFRKKRNKFSSRPSQKILFYVFIAVLAIELLGAAFILPSIISSSFFAPAVIAAAIAASFAARRLKLKVRKESSQAIHRPCATIAAFEVKNDESGQTLH